MKSYQVVIPSDINPLPETHEVSAARIISNFLHSDAEFVVRNNYKSADIKIDGVLWEKIQLVVVYAISNDNSN